ncbi:hypothetical protein E6R60_26830 [Streptomyces sp. A0642]|uniref:hypothetical protein n=1 Tax=Streptomyces sp. A0642 TaxID=2563100 RepID=UPI0010A27320|nr:hypothetical protein [Streptomyces sp. A0642]THA72546.1 hypothetical protein E6R60_26830 [Streptomyces sp. A0642]
MDFTSLLWDETGRDIDTEQSELARTAALTDASALVGPLLFQATDAEDFGHRLALAEPHLQAISTRRGYPVEDLAGDLTRRFEILAQATSAARGKQAEARRVTAAQEALMDAQVGKLAAHAARENPNIPMRECLRLATEAVAKHADSYPLAYESWNGTEDGPFTDRAKKWQPPALPGAKQPAAAAVPGSGAGPQGGAGPGMFDEVKQRLDDAENRVNQLSGPSRPSGPTSPTASLDEITTAGFMDRVKNWWNGNEAREPLGPPVTPILTHVPDPPSVPAATDHVEHSYTDGLMDGFDKHKTHLDEKWDANAAGPGASREYRDAHDPLHDTSNYTKGLMDVFDHAKSEIGTGAHHPAPAGVPGGFSHAETGSNHGQQQLPTDPTPEFSHPAHPDAAGGRNSGTEPIPSYFQYGAPR